MLYDIKVSGISNILESLNDIPRVIERAAVSALNKIADQSVTAASNKIREVFNIKARDVKSQVAIDKARALSGGKERRLFAVIRVKGKGWPLYDFGALPKEPFSQKGIPVSARKTATVKILQKQARRPVVAKAGYVPFVARLGSGHVGIFESRKGTRKIRELFSVGPVDMFASAGKDAVMRICSEKGATIFQHEIEYFTNADLKRKKK